MLWEGNWSHGTVNPLALTAWSWLSSFSFLSFSLSVFDNHFLQCLLIFSLLPLYDPGCPLCSQKPISKSVNINVQHHRRIYVNRINEDYKEYKLFFLEVYVLKLKMKIMIWCRYSKQRWVDCKKSNVKTTDILVIIKTCTTCGWGFLIWREEQKE